jgi:enolase-phosphatase E1
VEELDAAKAAGLRTGWLLRAPLAIPDAPRHPAYADFDAIVL